MEGPKIWKCSRKRDSDVSREARGEEWQKSNASEGMNLEAVGYRGVRNNQNDALHIYKQDSKIGISMDLLCLLCAYLLLSIGCLLSLL